MNKEKIMNMKFILMAIICICLFVIAIVPKELQNDTFYTIKLGKLILNNGIDMQEHFAFHEGLPYTYPHWLYDVGIYLIYSIGGFNALYISSIVLGSILGIIIYLTNAKLTKNTIVPFFTTILIMYIGRDFLTARAQLVTFILFVLTIYFIERFLETKKKRFAIGLIIIPILIANIHAAVFPFYFILYLPYLAEFFISFFLKQGDVLTKIFLKIDEIKIRKLENKQKLNKKQTEKLKILKNIVEKNNLRLEQKKNQKKEPYKVTIFENKNVIWLMVIMIIALFTGLLTPIGDTPYTYLIRTMKGNTTQNIAEHLPIVLFNSKYVLGYIFISLYLLTFTKVKLKLSDLFLFGGLILLTIMSRRQSSMLYFIGILVINKIICELIKMYDSKDSINIILEHFTSIIGRIIIYSVFVVFMIFQIKQTKNIEIVSNKDYPIEATKFIENNLDVNSIKLFNEYNFGSYLLFKDIPVFIDSRADVYDPKFNGWEDDIFRDFININSFEVDYEEKFNHYGITHLLIYNNKTLAKVLKKDNNYNELYRDDNFVIYQRLNLNKK